MTDSQMVRFVIEPRSPRAWLWRTLDQNGLRVASGVAPSEKIAAALVIRHILGQVGEGPLARAKAA